MRRARAILALLALLAAIILCLAVGVQPLDAGTSLELRIASATGIVRAVDAGLQTRAVTRATAIQTNFSHCCLSFNEAEVIAWNSGFVDPLAQLVVQWLNSPAHAAILRDPSYVAIGCATSYLASRTYGVCILRVGSTAPIVTPLVTTSSPLIVPLPDAAMSR